MSDLQAVVFDYGHTFLNFAPSTEKLLECYEEMRSILQAEAIQNVPDAQGFVDGVTWRIGQLVVDSYERQELDELDVITLFEDSLAALGVTLPRERIHQLAVMEHRAFVSDLTVPRENLAVLGHLKDLGMKLGLVSNAHFLPEMMREDLARLGIAPYLDDAVFSLEIGVRKPHPAIFRKVLGELGVSPSATIFVGDRVRDDIGGAQDLGMRGVLTRQYRQEDPEGTGITPAHIIDRLPDLVPYVERLLAG